MAEPTVASAILQIGKLLFQERHSLGAVSGKVEQLQKEMERMQCFLEDAEKKQDGHKTVLLWVSEVRGLAYDVEDAIATFVSEVESRREKGFLKKCKRYVSIFVEVAHLYKLSNEIEAIRGKLVSITNSLQAYGIKFKDRGEGSTHNGWRQQKYRQTYSSVSEDHTVGLINNTQLLLGRLVGDEHKHQNVISICGTGGIGKTTLAKKLFHHDDVRHHFDDFVWICVYKTFIPRQLLEKILSELTSSSIDDNVKLAKMNDDEVVKELNRVQQEKKCLVILDNIRTDADWDAIRHAFPIEKIAGKVLITTCNKSLSSYIDPDCYLHESQALLAKESWELFQAKAFQYTRDYEDIAHMEDLGREMVKKCMGVPLAIIILGGILAKKCSLDEWSLVHRNLGIYLSKVGDKEYSNVEAILALSYSELPNHLKTCMLYLSSGHGEEFLIQKSNLFRMWMGEGIVTKQLNEQETLEDIAESYLRELIDRCLVQIGEIGSNGEIKLCVLHELVCEFSLAKANQENFLERISVETENSKARRVVMHILRDQDPVPFALKKKRGIVSLVGRNCELNVSFFSGFKMLRLLSLVSCVITGKGIIKEIGKLILLKYLYISDSCIDHLPSSLGNLRYLQTLVFETYSRKLTISNKIWNFQELRYVLLVWRVTSEVKSKVELKLGNMRNLRSLKTVGPIYIEGMEKLPNIRKVRTTLSEVKVLSKVLNGLDNIVLDIDNCLATRTNPAMLSEGAVQELLTSCGKLQKLSVEGIIDKLPKFYQGFIPKLAKLVLTDCGLKEDPMPLLEKFPNLTYLGLWEAFGGGIIVCSSKGFPRLKTLLLMNSGLLTWQVDEGSMANLCRLGIYQCPKLKMIPEGIKYITTLSKLEILLMATTFTNRVRVIDGTEGEDYYKVRHVPDIVIDRIRC